MKFRVKKISPDVKLPTYSHEQDAAFDVYSNEDYTLKPGERHHFGLGFSAEFDVKYGCFIWDRGGLASKKGITSIGGLIDAGYRGEYAVVLLNTSDQPVEIHKGDRIAQMVIQKVEKVDIEEVETLSDSTRGGGWGSSGR
ncbi:MAG: dUTP diphosphatase [Parcubacteria group bacterium]